MKLNNKGFGMRETIIYMCILVAFLFVSVFNVNRLYASIENSNNDSTNKQQSVDNSAEKDKNKDKDVMNADESQNQIVDEEYYKKLETRLENATLNYMKEYNYDLTSGILNVTSATLIDFGYLTSMLDQYGNDTCSGYSNVYEDSDTGDYEIKSFIRCSNYSTKGF